MSSPFVVIVALVVWVLSISTSVGQSQDEGPIIPVLPRHPVLPSTDATPAQVALGRELFFDVRLSRDNTISCASCHDPKKGWADGRKVADGIYGKKGQRNVPTIVGSKHSPLLFWDGRARSLEEQIRQPIENPIEMDLPLAQLVTKLSKEATYDASFKVAFDESITEANVIGALAAFVRTVNSGKAPFDRYREGDLNAMSDAARRGHDVFFFRSNCSTCHRAPLFTDHEFHNLGVGLQAPSTEEDARTVNLKEDQGRFLISKNELDRHAFKTPSLRDVHLTAPYMHNGQFKTLREVVDFYAEGGTMNPRLDPLMNAIPLNSQERDDLVQFLKEGLASENYPD